MSNVTTASYLLLGEVATPERKAWFKPNWIEATPSVNSTAVPLSLSFEIAQLSGFSTLLSPRVPYLVLRFSLKVTTNWPTLFSKMSLSRTYSVSATPPDCEITLWTSVTIGPASSFVFSNRWVNSPAVSPRPLPLQTTTASPVSFMATAGNRCWPVWVPLTCSTLRDSPLAPNSGSVPSRSLRT